jgi:tetratricopeptide (TPR) repeat protein
MIRRLSLVLGFLCAGLGLLLALALASPSFCSSDSPAMVRYGEIALELGRFARFSDFAAVSDADAAETVHHQWLSEILSALGWKLLGLGGLWILKLLVLLGFGAGLLLAAGRRLPLWAAAALFAFSVFALEPRLMIRGDFFCLGVLALQMGVLLRAERTRRWRELYALIPAQLLGINLHPFGVLGLGIITLFLAERAVRGFLAGEGKERSRGLGHAALAWLGCLMASAVTPYGPKILVIFFASTIGGGGEKAAVMESIREFAPLSSFLSTGPVTAAKLLLFLGLGAALLGLWKRRVWLPVTAVLGVVMAWLHFRMIGFGVATAALALAAFLPEGIGLVQSRWAGAVPRLRLAALGIAVLAAAWTGAKAADALDDSLYVRQASLRTAGARRANLMHPWRAAAFVREQGIRGPCFNNYDTGSFLAFALPRENRIFIDTQFLYEPRFYFRYDRIMKGELPLGEEMQRYGLAFVFLRHISPETTRLLRELVRDRGWCLAYLDECAAVFLPRRGPNGALARRLELNLDEGDPVRFLWQGEAADPRAVAALGDFFARLGRPAQARTLYERALSREPRLFSAWNNLGVILMRAGDAEGALRCFLESIDRMGGYEKPRRNLDSLLKSGAVPLNHPLGEKARSLVD